MLISGLMTASVIVALKVPPAPESIVIVPPPCDHQVKPLALWLLLSNSRTQVPGIWSCQKYDTVKDCPADAVPANPTLSSRRRVASKPANEVPG